MRILVLFCSSLLFCINAHSQTKQSSFSFYTSLANDAEVFHKTLAGDWRNISNTSYFEAGAEYRLPLKRALQINAGLEFSRYRFNVSYTSYPNYPAVPDNQYNLSLLGLPVSLQFDFWKYAYLRGGIVVDVQTGKQMVNHSGGASDALPNQSGIGSVFGLGLQYPISKTLLLYTGMNNEMYGLILFSQTSDKKHIGDLGLRAGVRFRFE